MKGVGVGRPQVRSGVRSVKVPATMRGEGRGGVRERLIRILQHAHAGELGASLAYRGHGRSLSDPEEVAAIQEIEREEVHHRSCVRRMLDELQVEPDRHLEKKMEVIGRTIGLLCHIGGWFIPMYGAGWLESRNVKEYEDAARLAVLSGHPHFIEELLTMAEVEWEHERFFREKVQSHLLGAVFPRWKEPPPREHIRQSFSVFLQQAAPGTLEPATAAPALPRR